MNYLTQSVGLERKQYAYLVPLLKMGSVENRKQCRQIT